MIPWILICLLGSYVVAWHWLGGNPFAIWQIYNTLQRVETAIRSIQPHSVPITARYRRY